MNSHVKRVFFEDLVFDIFESVYEPADDSFLLAQNLQVVKNDAVLDVGTGCGLQAIVAAKKCGKVLATDINPSAVRCCMHNALLNGAADRIEVREGNLFEPLETMEGFDVIIFNCPYLPSEAGEENDLASRAWAGGASGRLVIDRFITQVFNYLNKDGRVLLVQSTLSDVEKSLRRLIELGMNTKVIAEKKVSFESIVVIEAHR